jgi:hypothetical protein
MTERGAKTRWIDLCDCRNEGWTHKRGVYALCENRPTEGGAVEALREALHPACRVENCRIEKLLDSYAEAIAQAAQEEAEAKVAYEAAAHREMSAVAAERTAELLRAEAKVARLREALQQAEKIIRTWHGMAMNPDEEERVWRIYRDRSPEMKIIRQALSDEGRTEEVTR